ncbi:MAG: ABC transporter permease [Emergencia sp.]|nr:ABC transporter permease [Emergencia sp.]
MNEGVKEKLIYLLKKAGQVLIVLLLLSIAVFVIARLCPGDPLKAYYGDGAEHMSEMEKDAARERLGLNDSIATQYFRWFENLTEGNLGLSYKYKQPVTAVIGNVWLNTLLLGIIAYLATFALAIALGMFCALREDRPADRIICRIGTISANVPSFFLALLLILVFSVNLGILPSGGAYDLGKSGDWLNRAVHLILPVSVLVLQHLWYYAYMVRNKLLEETRKDYVLLCKAEGIPRRTILCRHCFRNIMPSMLVIMAISLPHILGGTYVVEMVFGYPGLGTLSFEAAMYQDYNMLMALTMLTGGAVLIFNMLAQVLSERIDPRMEYEKLLQEAV